MPAPANEALEVHAGHTANPRRFQVKILAMINYKCNEPILILVFQKSIPGLEFPLMMGAGKGC